MAVYSQSSRLEDVVWKSTASYTDRLVSMAIGKGNSPTGRYSEMRSG